MANLFVLRCTFFGVRLLQLILPVLRVLGWILKAAFYVIVAILVFMIVIILL